MFYSSSMIGFEKLYVKDVKTFQFKPELDMLLITRKNIKTLEELFDRLGYTWHDGRDLVAYESAFEPDQVLLVSESKKVYHTTAVNALLKASDYAKEHPNEPFRATEYSF